ncbi:MAG: hypothetical protein U9O98_00375 [Asgard group archaeon]|nr:hypothetical protein [Asgard group archaeon]
MLLKRIFYSLNLSVYFLTIQTQDIIKYIILGLIALGIIFAIIYLIHRSLKRISEKNHIEKYENQIISETSISSINREIARQVRNTDYRKAIVANYHFFRLQSAKELGIRNCFSRSPQEIISQFRGLPNITLSNVQTVVDIYQKAKNTKTDITRDDYILTKQLIDEIC